MLSAASAAGSIAAKIDSSQESATFVGRLRGFGQPAKRGAPAMSATAHVWTSNGLRTAQLTPENTAKTVDASVPTHYNPNQPSKRAGEYFGLIWGVEGLSVKAVESGALIRFPIAFSIRARPGSSMTKRLTPSLSLPPWV
jgi:hypothetical protein